jgi:transcriptional regulator with XRE-family HTH domain
MKQRHDTDSTHAASLREAQLGLLAALERGEGAAPSLRRYPQHAAALIDLALARAGEDAAPAPDAAQVAATAAIARRALAAVAAAPALGLAERANRAGLSLRQLASRVGLSSDILFKIDRRVVRAETVPAALLRELGQALDCTAEAIRAGLTGGAPVTAGALYHAASAPQVGQQTFAEAVQSSVALDAESRARWLAAAQDDAGA